MLTIEQRARETFLQRRRRAHRSGQHHRCDPRECAPLTRPPRDHESYDLDRGRLPPALPTDADGQQLITPCQRNPQRWDRRSDMTIRQRSAAICRTECAALAECQKFLPFAQPGSVLAGMVLPVHQRPAVSG